MIVVMKMGASDAEIQGVEARIKELGFSPHLSRGKERTIIGVVGDDRRVADAGMFEALPGVAECVRILKPFKLAARDFVTDRTIVEVGPPGHAVPVGGHEVVVIAGPCAVESREQLEEVALAAKACGAKPFGRVCGRPASASPPCGEPTSASTWRSIYGRSSRAFWPWASLVVSAFAARKLRWQPSVTQVIVVYIRARGASLLLEVGATQQNLKL